ncbi:MAG: hypothetical protein JWQ21_2604 [Herminiimonas sp.]|nr:hypothetical protein [Herminiimonas sp.]
MRHRLYYLLPDIAGARRTLDDMLLSRIEQRHIRFMTSGASLPADMPEANVLFKTDLLHGAASGMVIGAVLSMALGALLVFYFETSPVIFIVAMLIGMLFGGLVCAWPGARRY